MPGAQVLGEEDGGGVLSPAHKCSAPHPILAGLRVAMETTHTGAT